MICSCGRIAVGLCGICQQWICPLHAWPGESPVALSSHSYSRAPNVEWHKSQVAAVSEEARRLQDLDRLLCVRCVEPRLLAAARAVVLKLPENSLIRARMYLEQGPRWFRQSDALMQQLKDAYEQCRVKYLSSVDDARTITRQVLDSRHRNAYAEIDVIRKEVFRSIRKHSGRSTGIGDDGSYEVPVDSECWVILPNGDLQSRREVTAVRGSGRIGRPTLNQCHLPHSSDTYPCVVAALIAPEWTNRA